MFKILYVTGSRAEFGIMLPLLNALNKDSRIDLSIVATGTHLDSKFGNTVKDIEDEGLKIVDRIFTKNTGEAIDIVNSIAKITTRLGVLFQNNKYDMTLILGDRQEMLPVANVSLIYSVPIVHFHGGEITQGNYDEFIRHAITKLSSIHFTTCDDYSNRIIRMGENPNNVHNIGSMAVDTIGKQKLPSFENIKSTYGIPFESKSYMVVLYHPVTLNSLEETMKELDSFVQALTLSKNNFILIGSNADVNSNFIRNAFTKLNNHNNFYQISSLKQVDYYSLLINSNGLVGNSSSGIIEASSLNIPVLNIGDRQKGRIHGKGVIDSTTDRKDISEGLNRLSSLDDFSNPYEKDDSVRVATSTIYQYLLDPIKRKVFYE